MIRQTFKTSERSNLPFTVGSQASERKTLSILRGRRHRSKRVLSNTTKFFICMTCVFLTLIKTILLDDFSSKQLESTSSISLQGVSKSVTYPRRLGEQEVSPEIEPPSAIITIGSSSSTDNTNEEEAPSTIITSTDETNVGPDEHLDIDSLLEKYKEFGPMFHAKFNSSLGLPYKLSGVEMYQRKRKKTLSLVISYCDKSLEWIKDYIGSYTIQDITIYNKCEGEVKGLEGLQSLTEPHIIQLPNIGRCDHSYAYWIKEHYQSIQDDSTKNKDNNIVVFLKDSNYDKDYYHSFNEVFAKTDDQGFGCVLEPYWCDCVDEEETCTDYQGMMQHNRTMLESFPRESFEHVRIARDEGTVEHFHNDKYPNLKAWKDDMGIEIPNSSKTLPVCYGGMFAVKRKRVLDQKKETWDRIEKSLTRENNLVEGHYAERLWASMFYGKSKKFVSSFDEFIGELLDEDTVYAGSCLSRVGMLMVEKKKLIEKNLELGDYKI